MKMNWLTALGAVAGLIALFSTSMWIPAADAQQSETQQAAPAASSDNGEAKTEKAASTKHGAAERGEATQCIRPTDDMRRNHFNYILHKRDRTMYKGIRTEDASLVVCVSCHAKKDEKTGEFMKASNPKHFCRECHDYTAVKVDCFGCHASRPVDGEDHADLSVPAHRQIFAKAPPTSKDEIAQLNAYLEGRKQ